MNKFFYSLALFLGINTVGYTQELYPEVMSVHNSIRVDSVTQKYILLGCPPRKITTKRSLPYSSLSNVSMRYIVQQVESDPSLKRGQNAESSALLLNYLRSENIRKTIDFVRNYTISTAQKEDAIKNLQSYVRMDSINYMNGLDEEHLDEPYISSLKSMKDFFLTDETYNWLKKISRDSVFFCISSKNNNDLNFWINTGNSQVYRYFTENRTGDSIGTWIYSMPEKAGIRILFDEGVYQANEIRFQPKKREVAIENPMDSWYFDLNRMDKGEIRRRYWTYYSEVDMSFSQGKLANWASGGENSLALLSNLRYFLNYNKKNTSWESWIYYRFGFLKSGKEELRKNEDRFELNSKLGQKAFMHWYYTLQFNTRTQLFSSYQYPTDSPRLLVANFMSPGYFTLSLGLDYKPNPNFSLFISPISGQWNFVRDTAKINPTRYGIEAGKRLKKETGARVDVRNNFTNIFKVINIRSEFSFFMSYGEDKKASDDQPKKPYTINWKVNADFKINYFLQATVYTETIFDENYSKKLQFRENFGLGLKFRL